MKPKFLRFCGSLALLLLAAALPLWLLWRRAELAREQGAELKSRAAQSAQAKDRDKKLSAAQQLAGLEAAPSRLSPDDFLKWETFCQDQPWTALHPVLETRAAQTSGEDEVRTLLLVRWASEDGPAALAWFRGRFPLSETRMSPAQSADLDAIGATWAWHDPAGFSAAQKAAAPGERMADAENLCRWLAPRDPALAFEAGRQPYNPSRDWTRPAAENISPYLKTPGDAAKLLELISKEKHSDHNPPSNYSTVILQAWADMDEAGALAAAKSYPGGNTLSLLNFTIHYVMRGRPQTEANADAWLEMLPTSSLHDVKKISNGLMSTDPAAAGRWLLKEDAHDRSQGRRDYLRVLAYQDPDAALHYAGSMPRDDWRGEYTAQVVAAWAQESPEGTTALLQSQGWSDTRIAQLKDRMAAEHPQAALWWWDW